MRIDGAQNHICIGCGQFVAEDHAECLSYIEKAEGAPFPEKEEMPELLYDSAFFN